MFKAHTILLVLALSLFVTFVPTASAARDTTAILADLIRPDNLATLRSRGANPRIQKCVYWLALARGEKSDPARILEQAVRQAGYTNAFAAQLTRDALLRNLDIAEKLGCLDSDGLSEMRKGNAPTIRRGPYSGQELSVDHIIPRTACVLLDNVIANLELMPQRLNSAKGNRVGDRQVALARTLHRAGLLADLGLRQVLVAARK